MSLKGIGGVESSTIVFKVVDVGGNPLSGKAVTFGLSTTVGGIALTSSTATSDAAGLVQTIVNSGKVSTPVRVTASTADIPPLTTLSSGLTITTGIPDQDSFSLSATTLNIEGANIDGTTTVLAARLADHFNNPVPEGTVVNFTTEGGSIVSSCTTVGGACSSTLTSQDPRPIDGRVTVLAYAVGEESFIDLNGNGVADLAPTEMVDINGGSTDMPEAFRDDNENGIRDASETFIDFNSNNIYDGPDGKYDGVLCDNTSAPPTGSSAGTCSTTKSIHVRKSIVIVFSTSSAVITKIAPAGTIDLNANGFTLPGCGGSATVDLRVVDQIGNAMPAGTTIAVATSDGTILGNSSFTQSNTNVTPPAGKNFSVVINSDGLFTPAQVGPPAIAASCVDSTAAGLLTVTVTTPGGGARGTTLQQFPVIN